MEIYLAPLEGVTGYIVRNAFAHNFRGIDKYYTPFIPAAKRMNRKILRDIAPENNVGIRLIPQLMSNRAQEVLDMAHQLQEYGYREVNLNLGCPSGTVVSKHRGSGLLAYPDELDTFLYGIFEKADFPVSVKTRVGFSGDFDWENILEIYGKYPLCELTVHPRVRADFYKGSPRLEDFDLAYERYCEAGSSTQLCYNGDITDAASCDALMARYPKLQRVMIGRGLLANPALAQMIADRTGEGTSAGSDADASPDNLDSYRSAFRAFHDEIFDGFCNIFPGEKDAMFHMKEIWGYLIASFADGKKLGKKIRKAQSVQEYRVYVNELFEHHELNIINFQTESCQSGNPS